MVSVIIPVYNGEKTICRAVDSALSQKVELEVLVIDDCSGDRTAEVLERYAGDERVRILKNQRNMGAAESRNHGVQKARGEYVAFLDADDAWMPGKLRAQLELLRKKNGVICSTARRLVCPGDRRDGQIIHVPGRITYRMLLSHNSIACSSVVMKTAAAREFPMEHAEVHEDYLTWLRLLKKYEVCYGVDQPFLLYTLSTTGKSGSKLHSARMTFGVYRRAGLSLPKSCLCFVSYVLHGLWKYYYPDKDGKNKKRKG